MSSTYYGDIAGEQSDEGAADFVGDLVREF